MQYLRPVKNGRNFTHFQMYFWKESLIQISQFFRYSGSNWEYVTIYSGMCLKPIMLLPSTCTKAKSFDAYEWTKQGAMASVFAVL